MRFNRYITNTSTMYQISLYAYLHRQSVNPDGIYTSIWNKKPCHFEFQFFATKYSSIYTSFIIIKEMIDPLPVAFVKMKKKMLWFDCSWNIKICTVECYPRITQYFLNYLMLTRNLAVHNTLSIMYYVTAMYHSNVCTHVRGVWVSVLNHSTTLLKKMQTPTLIIGVYIIHWASFIILSNEYNPYFRC